MDSCKWQNIFCIFNAVQVALISVLERVDVSIRRVSVPQAGLDLTVALATVANVILDNVSLDSVSVTSAGRDRTVPQRRRVMTSITARILNTGSV